MSNSGNGVKLIVLIIGIAVLILGVGGMFGIGLGAPVHSEEIRDTFRLPEGRRIEVHGRNGTITVDTWASDEVQVVAVKEVSSLFGWLGERIAQSVDVRIVEDARGVTVSQDLPLLSLFTNVRVRYHVTVPEGWSGDYVLRTSNGRIETAGLSGNVDIRTSNGRVTIDGVTGDVNLHTSNGPISVERLEGSLSASTSNGAIELRDVSGEIEAESSNGAIRVEGARLTGNGHFVTSNGAVNLRGALDPESVYEARTSNGRITLVLIDPDVSLDLRTSNGAIHLNADVIASEIGRNRLVGRIGEGTSQLSVRTSNGDVSLSVALAQ